MKKKLISVVLAAVMVIGLVPISVSAASVGVLPNEEPGFGTINVNGQATILAEPDIALVRVGVNAAAETAREAINEAVEAMDALIAALKELGIEEIDIRTSSYSMDPQFDWNMQHMVRGVMGPVLIGYSVRHMLDVTVRDIDKVGDVLTAAAEAGSNQSDGIRFMIADETALQHKALAVAIEDAKERAQVMADALGVTLGAPLSVSEFSGGFFDPFWGSGGGRVMAMADMAMDVSPISVQAGQVGVNVSVSMVFSFER